MTNFDLIQPILRKSRGSFKGFELSIDDLKINPLYVEPIDLKSAIKEELGQIFTSLNILFVRPVPFNQFERQAEARSKVDRIYEQVRLEVM